VPLKATKLNLGTLLRRLGIAQAPQQLPLAAHVSPVALVSDLSKLSSQIDPAEGVTGINGGVVVGNVRGYQLLSLAPGGIEILSWVSYNPAGGGAVDDARFTFAVGPPNPAAAFPANIPNSVNPSNPCVSRWGLYFQAASYTITLPDAVDKSYIGGSITATKVLAQQMRGPIFVPRGQAFIIESFLAGWGIAGHVHFREFPAAQLAAEG
jgi:hypothetical protein